MISLFYMQFFRGFQMRKVDIIVDDFNSIFTALPGITADNTRQKYGYSFRKVVLSGVQYYGSKAYFGITLYDTISLYLVSYSSTQNGLSPCVQHFIFLTFLLRISMYRCIWLALVILANLNVTSVSNQTFQFQCFTLLCLCL